MMSSYPSSYSFFDATSDSIRAEDVDRCRSSSSISSLADLFTNPTCKSDLFPKARVPVLVSEEVRFPAKKKRECEERTSIWHEWGSGECQTENVAQESSGFSSDLFKSSGPKCSEFSSISPVSSFPNLGSACVSLVTEEFSFPARKKREDGSSWREERTSRQDWNMSGSPKDNNSPTECSTPVSSMKDMYPSKLSPKPFNSSSSKSSLFSHLAAHPASGTSDELSFPARKKRDERKVWQDCSMDGAPSGSQKVATVGESTSCGVSSLADLYLSKPGSKCSGLFSDVTSSNTEEVVFPKRKIRADRNAWRDWANTGYDDWEDESNQEILDRENSTQSACTSAAESSYVLPRASSIEESIGRPEEFSMTVSLPAATAVHEMGSAGGVQPWDPTNLTQASDADFSLNGCPVGNVDESTSSDVDAGMGISRPLPFATEVERTMDGGESSRREIQMVYDDELTSRFRSAKSDQRSSRHNGKYPPPLGSLSRQGSLRVPHHMPWVQLQPIRSHGRFMLQEVKVTQPVVFQPIRKEGRLVLQLIGKESGLHDEEKAKRFRGDKPVTEAETSLFPEKKDVMELSTKEIEEKGVAEKMDGKQVLESPVFIEIERKKSSTVLPVFETPQKFEGEEKNVGVGAEAATGTRKSVNSRELCGTTTVETISASDLSVSEPDRAFDSDGGFIQDKPPPWPLGKPPPPEERRYDSRSWPHSDVGFRERLPLSTSEAPERPGKKGNIIILPRARENGALRGTPQFQTSSLTHLRNGLASLTNTRVEGEPSQTRSPSKRNLTTAESSKEECSSYGSVRGRAPDAKPSLSVYQGLIRDTVLNLSAVHSFLRFLRTRPDLPGEPDPRLSNYTPLGATVFSCADGMGKRHHEKNIWEQLPCVS